MLRIAPNDGFLSHYPPPPGRRFDNSAAIADIRGFMKKASLAGYNIGAQAWAFSSRKPPSTRQSVFSQAPRDTGLHIRSPRSLDQPEKPGHSRQRDSRRPCLSISSTTVTLLCVGRLRVP